MSIKVIEAERPDDPIQKEKAGDPEISRRHRHALYQIYKREFEAQDRDGRHIEAIDLAEAKSLRRMLYEEYKQECENSQ